MPVKNGDYICTRHEKIIKNVNELYQILIKTSPEIIHKLLEIHQDTDKAHYMGIRMEQGLLAKNRTIKKLERKISKLEGI